MTILGIHVMDVVVVVKKESRMSIKNLFSKIRIPANKNPYLKESEEEEMLIKVKLPSNDKCVWIKSNIDLYYDICDK